MCYVIERKQLIIIYAIDLKYFFGFKKYITHVKILLDTIPFDEMT